MKVDGNKIRQLRLKSQRTLQELALDAGISTGFLSQIERGLSEPSLDSALRISGSLNVPMSAIALAEDTDEPSVSYSGVYRDRFVTPESATTLQVLEAYLEPGRQSRVHAYAHHEDEECVFVIEGLLDLTVGDETRRLAAGESLLFDPRERHSYANPGSDPVRWLWISAR